MAFSRFGQLPPEIRNHIWKDFLDEEADGRLFFLHRWTFRILPTQNNISPLFSVSVESRALAKSFYNLCVPVHRLPPWGPAREPMSCKDWLWHTSKIRWGKGIGSQGQQGWTGRERYWYHYALTKAGDSAQGVLRGLTDEMCSPRGCVYFNAATDRFVLSYDAYTRDKAELDPQMDVCVYQMTLDRKAKALGSGQRSRKKKKKHSPLHEYEVPRRHFSSRLPAEAMGQLRNIVFVDVKDGPTGGVGEPQALFGSTLGVLWVPLPEEREAGFRLTYLADLETRGMMPAEEEEVDLNWWSDLFPAILTGPRTVHYLEILTSRSCTLVGEVEKRTARCLDIVELKIDKPNDDGEATNNGEYGNML
ncbi:hypothetical protein PG996_010895 [Apiospora saccharicola]|uniref:2EXR domain-containing protein n=1 Tax=Apiospora saccharicola TaxID=335842 RepID=A0ABR1USE4_9PEZI